VVDHIEHVIKVAGEDAVGSARTTTASIRRSGSTTCRCFPAERGAVAAGPLGGEREEPGENFLAFFARVRGIAHRARHELPSTAVFKK
jgi:hypothetical protein